MASPVHPLTDAAEDLAEAKFEFENALKCVKQLTASPSSLLFTAISYLERGLRLADNATIALAAVPIDATRADAPLKDACPCAETASDEACPCSHDGADNASETRRQYIDRCLERVAELVADMREADEPIHQFHINEHGQITQAIVHSKGVPLGIGSLIETHNRLIGTNEKVAK